MANIILARVDNRLIHGQVAHVWTSHVQANLILVADDDVETNEQQKALMQMTAPDHVQTRFFSIQKTIDIIHKAADHQKIFLVTRTPIQMEKLISGGVPIKEVNIGNMHDGNGKTAIIPQFLHADEKEIEALKKMDEMGIRIYGQASVISKSYDINKEIKNF